MKKQSSPAKNNRERREEGKKKKSKIWRRVKPQLFGLNKKNHTV